MGKKKHRADVATNQDPNEPKAQKSYSYSTESKSKSAAAREDGDSLIKVQLPPKMEAAILDLIRDHKGDQTLSGSASFRLTAKKLTDMFNSLSDVGFKHSQIESAMSNVVQYGGDLADALDWLCLNTPNDQLPGGFSQSLAQEDQKKRAKFTAQESPRQPFEAMATAEASSVSPPQVTPTKGVEKEASPVKASVKSWILQYANIDSESDPELDEEGNVKVDVCERYLELTALLLDARSAASMAKDEGDKAQARKIGSQISKYIQEMEKLESDPDFNPAIKIKDIDGEKRAAQKEAVARTTDDSLPSAASCEPAKNKDLEEDFDGLNLGALEEQVAKESPKKPQKAPPPEKFEKRSFAYTRQQWTGKSPKQFLIDWVRKHLPKSPAPSYKHVKVRGNLWKSRVRVVQKDGDLDVCVSDIVCENVKDAEHLASTLALYNLCRGQRIYQLLPPPFRDVWLEWLDKETKASQDLKAEENKPRDQFVSKLIKKLKVESQPVVPSTASSASQEVEETWEDLDTEEDEPQTPAEAGQSRRYTGVPSSQLLGIYQQNTATRTHKKLLETRKQLPVFGHHDNILDTIRRHSVVVVAGETGSGKSTQIPQFLLEDLLKTAGERSSVGTIVCTQPRRISATSLAKRVSEELGETGPGKPNSLCGYQIRFESKKCETTRLVYCTTGVVLRQLQQDPQLQGVSMVIVDEVHERSVQSDFLMIILRQLLEKRSDLKVVLMSATLDAHKFSAYFQHCPVIEIPGRTFPVQVHHLEDVLEMTGYTLDSDSIYCLRDDQLVQEYKSSVTYSRKGGNVSTLTVDWTRENISSLDMSDLEPEKYSLKSRNIVTRMNQKRINLDLIMELLTFLDTDPTYSSIDGAVLVFLPGLVHIRDLYDSLLADRVFSDQNRYKIVALHSVLSSEDQGAAFTVPPAGVRKVVIATNIAETGITIPDVVFVIDAGKVKENRYRETTQLSSLEEVYVSQASARQRQGRAGRVRDGICFRIYTHNKYKTLEKYSVPEILRVPLEELCLHILKCDLGHPAEFLGRALDPPQPLALSRAMSILREVGACDPQTPSLTPLGHHLAALPVNVRVGKMLVYAAIFGCLEPVAIISASLTEKSPFVVPMTKRDQADNAKRSLAVENSDHLTLLKAFLLWNDARQKGYQAEMTVCQKFYLKKNSLAEIENISLDLIKLLKSSGFGTSRPSQKTKQSKSNFTFTADHLNSKMSATIKAVLAAGLYPNVAAVHHQPKVDSVANPEKQVCHSITPQGSIEVHPGSVNRYLGANGWLVYHEKVKLGRPYIRDSTLVSAYPLLLFGGGIDVQHKDQIITVDDWIKLKAFAKTAVIFKELRKLVNVLLAKKVQNPEMSIEDDPVVRLIVELIISDKRR